MTLTHYAVARDGIITVTKTRKHSPAGSIIPQFWHKGRLRVRLTDDNGRRVSVCVHKLVWETYATRQPDEGEEIAFLDGNPINVHFDNLCIKGRGEILPAVIPPSQQNALVILQHIERGVIHSGGGKKTRLFGEANPNAVLTAEMAFFIRYIAPGRITQQEIADRLCISQAAVSHCQRGKTWGHVLGQLMLGSGKAG
jgi:hypothetical protein